MDGMGELHPPEHIIVSSKCIMILILLSIFGNLLVCLAVYHSRNLQSQVNYFIVSLAISDILVAVFSMPIWLTYEITQFRNLPTPVNVPALVKGWTFIDILCGVSSICNLTAISFERFWSISSPLSHRRFMATSCMAWPMAIVWMYSIIVSFCYLLGWQWKYNTVMTAILAFFFPLILITVAYLGVCCILIRGRKGDRGHVISRHDNRRINVTVLIIIAAFVLCWGPFFIVSILGHYHIPSRKFFVTNKWITSSAKWLHYLNSCINPFIYGICNSQYKEAFKIVLRRLCLSRCFNHYDDYIGANARNSATTETLNTDKRKEFELKEIDHMLVSMTSTSLKNKPPHEARRLVSNEYNVIPSIERSSNV